MTPKAESAERAENPESVQLSDAFPIVNRSLPKAHRVELFLELCGLGHDELPPMLAARLAAMIPEADQLQNRTDGGAPTAQHDVAKFVIPACSVVGRHDIGTELGNQLWFTHDQELAASRTIDALTER